MVAENSAFFFFNAVIFVDSQRSKAVHALSPFSEPGGPEAVPGSIGLVYSDLTDLVARLERGGHDALEETAFAWKEDSDGTINVTCPYGEGAEWWCFSVG